MGNNIGLGRGLLPGRGLLCFLVGLLVCVSVLVSPSLGAFKLFLDDTADASPGFYVTDDVFAPVAPNQPDAYPGLGKVAFLGNVGGFSVVVTTAVSKPILGPPPELDLITLTVSGSSPGVLQAWTSDSGYEGSGGAHLVTTSMGGTTTGSVRGKSYVDDSNAEFGTATALADLGPFTAGAFAGEDSEIVSSLSSPYSMTIQSTITHHNAGDITSFNIYMISIPEPSTLALGLLGLLGLLGWGLSCRRSRRGY